MPHQIRIATRKSRLALWQAEHVQQRLEAQHQDIKIELVPLVTQGDREQHLALTEMGGKSLFVKELQRALLEHAADIAVHSIKDLSVHPQPGLTLGAICKREDPRDVFISTRYNSLNEMPAKSIIGTASPRRQSIVLSQLPHCDVKLLRGNVDTRLEKLAKGEYDAIILAAAGIKRLDKQDSIQEYLDPEIFVPAIGQGAIGIECREDDLITQELVNALDDVTTHLCVTAERTVNRVLGGDCHTPIGAYAKEANDTIYLTGVVGSLDGTHIIQSHTQGPADEAVRLGQRLADDLLAKGANDLLS